MPVQNSPLVRLRFTEKCISKLTLYNYSTMMLMHESHVFELLIEVSFHCLIFAVVTVSYVVACKA